MSEYSYRDDDRVRRRSVRTARDRDPEFVEETTYIQRGHAPHRELVRSAPIRDLVYRGRDESVEEIERDFPPPRSSRRARSVGRRGYDYDSEDDYYDYYERDRAPRRGRLSRRESYGYYSDDYDRPRRRRRSKSRVEEVLEDVGLGGVAATATNLYKKARSKSRSRFGGRSRSSSSSRSRSDYYRRGPSAQHKWQQAAKAAAVAGVVEAIRSRKQPGAWTGEKGTRVATAALSAGGIGGFVDKGDAHSKRHTAEAVVGGLVSNRLVNGSRSRSRGRDRSRSISDSSIPARSRSRSIVDRFRSMSRGRDRSRSSSPDSRGSRGRGFKQLAAGGALAAAGKAIYDRVRSKSRRRRSPSSSSADSYVPSRTQRYRRRSRDRDNDRSMDDRSSYAEQGASGGGAMMRGGGAGAMMRGGGGGGSGSDMSESTTDLESQTKRLRGKELITAGLATAATIHAVHGVWNSISASEKRHKLVAEGEMSPEEARKRRSKALLQDAAAVGVAALGIKGAFSEWKEMKEHRDEVRNLENKRRKRRKMHERTARELRKQGLLNNGPPYGYGFMPPGAMMAPQYPPPPMGMSSYADGNPYGGGIPNASPPPTGAPSERY